MTPTARWVRQGAHPTVAHYRFDCGHFCEEGIVKWPPRVGTAEELAHCRPCNDCAPKDAS